MLYIFAIFSVNSIAVSSSKKIGWYTGGNREKEFHHINNSSNKKNNILFGFLFLPFCSPFVPIVRLVVLWMLVDLPVSQNQFLTISFTNDPYTTSCTSEAYDPGHGQLTHRACSSSLKRCYSISRSPQFPP